jgi:hypothetical protein
VQSTTIDHIHLSSAAEDEEDHKEFHRCIQDHGRGRKYLFRLVERKHGVDLLILVKEWELLGAPPLYGGDQTRTMLVAFSFIAPLKENPHQATYLSLEICHQTLMALDLQHGNDPSKVHLFIYKRFSQIKWAVSTVVSMDKGEVFFHVVADLAAKNRLLTLFAENGLLQIDVGGREESSELVVDKA